MTELKKKVKLALDEARLLVLGGQILLGFQFQSVMQPGFDLMPAMTQRLKVVGLLGMLLTILMLMWPAGYHQIAENGEVTGRVHRFATWVMTIALWPFASVLGLEVFAVAQSVTGTRRAVAAGIMTNAIAVFFWWGLAQLALIGGRGVKERAMTRMQQQRPPEATQIFDKVDHVLTECRVVIPGAQALLGFQLIAVLADAFKKLPRSSQEVHLAALLLIGFSMCLLMTPAAYHRIVEAGEPTEEFWRHTRRMLLSAMAVLAAGLAAELYVILEKILASTKLSITISGVAFCAFAIAWFGYPFWVRTNRGRQRVSSGPRHQQAPVEEQ